MDCIYFPVRNMNSLSAFFLGSKYQYSSDTSYTYSYESSNELQAERASEMLTQLRATVTFTSITKCEMVLEVRSIPILFRNVKRG